MEQEVTDTEIALRSWNRVQFLLGCPLGSE